MIQLANDPNASRSWRPAADDGKGQPQQARHGRPGHAWPFLSKGAARPTAPDSAKKPSHDSGS